ncbi:hypothetical protein ARMA_1695 [Ardenticatena maritima]|uniref:OmpR/PhoB-type domain-containing protein n=1 Tax=Ardenticatena maritima TaxID=872965 RepID=A0A0M8K953_9CHLR|nr:winged helix-turn-helix domain-containing protein [Ardenticatena maritima]GAP63272.1 hypothetical protein ARMA_1695 [Ardenticatena maritima]
MARTPALFIRNPYAENRPASPEMFYGRAADVRWMIERLAKPYPDSLAIAGPRRIGKTSLLHYVRHAFQHPDIIDEKVTTEWAAYRNLLALGWPHLHVYVDASRLLHSQDDGDETTAPRFWRILLRALLHTCEQHHEHLDIELPAWETVEESDWLAEILEDALDTLALRERRVIFYLDEVEKKSFPVEVGQVLRSFAMQYGAAFVIASHRSLLEWLDDPTNYNSPFYNMLSYRYLRPLPSDEAYTLLTDPGRRELSPTWMADHEPLLAALVEATGGHPSLVKLAGERLWDLSVVQQRATLSLEEVLNHVRLQGEPTFMSIWNALDESEREVVRMIAQGEREACSPDHARVCEILRRDGVLVETEQGWRVFSPLFAEYVRDMSPVEQESALRLEEMQVYVAHAETPIALTKTEHRLLAFLLAHRGRTCSREAILAHVWNKHEDNKVLDVTIQRLRRKIEPDPREPRYLITVRGEGYRLDA